MWYFAWILGLPLAVTFAVLNAMWFELVDDGSKKKQD
ncbi:cytochrome bd-I oxidase subunit CydX [Ketogulonicigenium robustum]|nr:cytochrome bd-I oxidase subunit CydX [Ketogulonicigenium robustum]